MVNTQSFQNCGAKTCDWQRSCTILPGRWSQDLQQLRIPNFVPKKIRHATGVHSADCGRVGLARTIRRNFDRNAEHPSCEAAVCHRRVVHFSSKVRYLLRHVIGMAFILNIQSPYQPGNNWSIDLSMMCVFGTPPVAATIPKCRLYRRASGGCYRVAAHLRE
jgi:hypothetical protein